MPQWLVIGISGVTCGGKTTLAHKLRDYFLSQRNIPLWNTPYSISDVQMISQDDYFLPVDDLRHKWVEPLNAINFELITSLDMKQMLSDITWTMKGRYLAGDPMENVDYNNDMSLYSGGNFEHFPAHMQHYNTNYMGQQHQNPSATTTTTSTTATHLASMHHLSAKPQQQQHKHVHHQTHQLQAQAPHHNMNNAHLHTSHIMRINSQMMAQLRDNKINILIVEGFMIFNQPELLTLCNIKFHFHLPYERCFERRRKRTYDPPDVVGYFEMCVWPHYEKNFQEFRERKDITFLNGEISKEKILKFVLQHIVRYFEERCDVACPPPHKLLGIPSCSNGNMANPSPLQACPMEQQ